ncbi:MAG TPA: nucleotidyltransferase family protein [Chryseolinea sp.]|nr:nucleotidyltransferase family protein [Chryseolinea sp.]
MKPHSDPENAGDPASEPAPLNFVTLLLAAGASSRMGQSKQLLDVGGMPLLRRSAEVALTSGSSAVVVVLGANEEPHRDVIADLPVEVVVNHYWKSGMGSSIKTGLHYILHDHGEATAVLIMVCDQPELSSSHLVLLRDHYTHSQKKIAASAYDNTLGVPAMFGRSFFSNILMLRDDQGAKKIIDQFAEQVVSIPFPAGSIDLDTSDDYTRYLGNQ